MSLPKLATIGEVIKLYGLTAKQQLSQNFLLDLNITDRMVRAAGDVTKCHIVEVGSGPGSLTRSALLLGTKKLIAVEKDGRFLPALNALQKAVPSRMSIAYGDALFLDEEKLFAGAPKAQWNEEPCTRILGNLPFAVSTALLLKWIRQIEHREGAFKYGRTPFVLTFQAEVADRIIAQPGSKEYGRLSVMVQQSCMAKNCFTIYGKSFVPPPDVDARVLYIEPLYTPVAPVSSLMSLEYVLREVFSMRRKRISNSILRLGHGAEEILQEAKINPNRRPEEVTVEEWCAIANAFDKWPQKKYSNFFDYDPPKGIPENYTEQALLQVYQPLRQAQLDREERKKEEKQLREERDRSRQLLTAKSVRLANFQTTVTSRPASAPSAAAAPVEGKVHLETEDKVPGLVNYNEIARLAKESRYSTTASSSVASVADKEDEEREDKYEKEHKSLLEDDDDEQDQEEEDKEPLKDMMSTDQVSESDLLRYVSGEKIVNRLFSPTVVVPVRNEDGTISLPAGIAPHQLQSMFGNMNRRRELAREMAAKLKAKNALRKSMLPDPPSRPHSSPSATDAAETPAQPTKKPNSLLDPKRASSLPSPAKLLSLRQKEEKKKQKENAEAFEKVSGAGGMKANPAAPYEKRQIPYSKRFPGRSSKEKRKEQLIMSRM